MIKISKMADHALVLMAEMAQSPALSHSASALAERTDLGLATVTKLLKLLTKSHLLKASRGQSGGYVLMKPTNEIDTLSIVEAIDGPIALTDCALKAGMCAKEKHCKPKKAVHLINEAITKALKEMPLSRLSQVENPDGAIHLTASASVTKGVNDTPTNFMTLHRKGNVGSAGGLSGANGANGVTGVASHSALVSREKGESNGQ